MSRDEFENVKKKNFCFREFWLRLWASNDREKSLSSLNGKQKAMKIIWKYIREKHVPNIQQHELMYARL